MLGWDSFNVHLGFKVGGGDRVRLWYDSWCGDVPLKDSYSVLFECTSNKAATIIDVLLRVQGRQDWNVTFTCNFNDWEMDLVVSFLNLLQSNIPAMEVEDGLWWKLKKTGRFNTRSYYEALRDPPQVDFPWKSIWRSKAPRRASFFIWTAAWNKVWTCDNLRKRGHFLPSWCCMCRCNGESADHLLIHCSAASVLWCWVFRAFGIQWVLPGVVADVLRCWWNGLGRHSSDVWNLVPLCVMCLIWKERNCRTFEDISSSESQLIESFATTLFDWSRTRGFSSTMTVIEFISSLSLSHDIVLT